MEVTRSKHAESCTWLAVICELDEIQLRRGRYFLNARSHSADSWDQPTWVVDFMNSFPDTFLTVTDSCLFGPNETLGKVRRCPQGCCMVPAASQKHSPSNLPGMRQTIMKAMSQQPQSDFWVVAGTQQPHHRPPLPCQKLLRLMQMKNPEWSGKRVSVRRGPVDPHDEVKTALGVRVRHQCGARAESNPVDFKWINTNKGGAEAPRYHSCLMCTEVRCRGVEPICVVEDPFLISIADVSVSSPFLR